jgi:flagellar basal body rod protein FlgG
VSSGIYIATGGAVAQAQALDVTANNVANASTPGYKAARVSFAQTLAKSQDMAIVGVAGTGFDPTPGVIQSTDDPLDVAVDGDGWLGVNTPAGPRWTRDGDFGLDDDGRLVTASGLPVMDAAGGEIVVPAGARELSIAPDGSVVADGATVGQIAVARFAPGALAREGLNLYVASAPPMTDEPAQLVSGALEGANFNVVRGVIDLVKVSRSYEALHRMIDSYREIDQRTARELGGPK